MTAEEFGIHFSDSTSGFLLTVCLAAFLIATIGCRNVTNSSGQTPQPITSLSVYHSPTNLLNKPATARQIVLTNAFVHAGIPLGPLAAGSRQTDETNDYFGFHYTWRTPTPTNLANQIAGADHIVVRNWAVLQGDTSPTTLLLSGDAAKQLLQAVSYARLRADWGTSNWMLFLNWELQFYRGTEELAFVHFIGDVFQYDNNYYTDVTGVLRRIAAIAQESADSNEHSGSN